MYFLLFRHILSHYALDHNFHLVFRQLKFHYGTKHEKRIENVAMIIYNFMSFCHELTRHIGGPHSLTIRTSS